MTGVFALARVSHNLFVALSSFHDLHLTLPCPLCPTNISVASNGIPRGYRRQHKFLVHLQSHFPDLLSRFSGRVPVGYHEAMHCGACGSWLAIMQHSCQASRINPPIPASSLLVLILSPDDEACLHWSISAGRALRQEQLPLPAAIPPTLALPSPPSISAGRALRQEQLPLPAAIPPTLALPSPPTPAHAPCAGSSDIRTTSPFPRLILTRIPSSMDALAPDQATLLLAPPIEPLSDEHVDNRFSIISDDEDDELSALRTQALATLPARTPRFPVVPTPLTIAHLLPGVAPGTLRHDQKIIAEQLLQGTAEAINSVQHHLFVKWRPESCRDNVATENSAFPRAATRGGGPPKGKDRLSLAAQYDLNRSRTFRRISGHESLGKEPLPAVAEHFFPQAVAAPDAAPLLQLLPRFPPIPQPQPWSLDELSQVILRLKNKSPGPDRVSNDMIKRQRTLWPVLLALLNAVLHTAIIPESWKQSRTTLIGKPSCVPDGLTAGHYRPICMQNTTYKLFATLLCERLSRHIDDRISPLQKGFRAGIDGVHANNFLLKAMFAEAQRGKQLLIAILDIRNAFGSIDHTLLLHTLEAIGVDYHTRTLFRNIYASHVTVVDTHPPHECHVRTGILQGDPLSPLLSNLFFDTLTRQIPDSEGYLHASGARTKALQFADDLLIPHHNREGMQVALDHLSRAATALGLTFGVNKCHILATTRGYAQDTGRFFSLQGQTVHHAVTTSVYTYLGVPYGSNISSLSAAQLPYEISRNVADITASALRPWQKLDALRTFVQSKLTFALRETPLSSATLESLKKSVRSLARHAIAAPFFPSKVLHLPVAMGGTGVWDVSLVYHVSSLSGALSLLNSPCPHTRVVARYEAASPPHNLHLPFTPDPSATSFRAASASPWKRLRHAVSVLFRELVECSIHFPEGDWRDTLDTPVTLRFMTDVFDGIGERTQHALLTRIHAQRAAVKTASEAGSRMREILDSPPTLEVISSPQFLSNRGWEFHWAARHWQLRSDRAHHIRCCGVPSTAGHCNSPSCTLRARSVIRRHNDMGKLILTALRSAPHTTAVWESTRLPLTGEPASAEERQKPDLLVENTSTGRVFIFDLAITIHLQDAYDEKITKYQERARQLQRTTGKPTTVHAIILSPWGAVHPKSLDDLALIGVPAHTITTLWKKLICMVCDRSACIFATGASPPSDPDESQRRGRKRRREPAQPARTNY